MCVATAFMIIFLIISKEVGFFGAIASACFLSLCMIIYLSTILSFLSELDHHNADMDTLFYPFFDTSLFLILSSLSHYRRLRKIIRLKNLAMEGFNIKSFIAGLLLIPMILLLSLWINTILRQINLSMIIALVILRNILEFGRFNAIRSIETSFKK